MQRISEFRGLPGVGRCGTALSGKRGGDTKHRANRDYSIHCGASRPGDVRLAVGGGGAGVRAAGNMGGSHRDKLGKGFVLAGGKKALEGNERKVGVFEVGRDGKAKNMNVKDRQNVFTRLYLNLYSQKSRHNRMVIKTIREARMREIWEARIAQLNQENNRLVQKSLVEHQEDSQLSSRAESNTDKMLEEASTGSSRLSRNDPLFRALEFNSDIKGFSISSSSRSSSRGSGSNDDFCHENEPLGGEIYSKNQTCCFSQMCKELSQDQKKDQTILTESTRNKMGQPSSSRLLQREFEEDQYIQPKPARQTIATIVSILNNRTGEIAHHPCISDKELNLHSELSDLLPTRANAQDMDIETEDETVVVAQRNGYATLLEAVVIHQMGGFYMPGFYC
jgi:hypothetical protein